MNIVPLCVILLGFLSPCVLGEKQERQPNIVIILADDMGSYDVSYRGSNQFITPNIDALGYNGVIFDKHYTEAICTPSRAALLTGQYPMRLGFQGSPIFAGEDRHLPVDVQTLPKLLKQLGYSTHLVGKWHLGSARRRDTPTAKGFDTHYGYWNGYVGYFDYKVSSMVPSTEQVYNGFDLKKNFTDSWADQGRYATELFTKIALERIENQDKDIPIFLMVSHLAVHTGKDEEVEVLDEKVTNRSYSYIEDFERRRYADALVRMDDSVGQIVAKLQEQKMLDNSVVIFMSDNGAKISGMYHNGGSNFPLRGQKSSLHEGGVRNAALLYSPLLKVNNYVHEELIHLTDWFPTLYGLAGGNASSLKGLDGIDQWQSISQQKPTSRKEILVNIDEEVPYSAIIGYGGRYKLLNGTAMSGSIDQFGPEPKNQDRQYNISEVLNSLANQAIRKSQPEQKYLDAKTIKLLRHSASSLKNAKCAKTKKRENPEICFEFCLFDLKEDPCETENLVKDKSKQAIVEGLKTRMSEFWREMVPQTNKLVDKNSNPAKYNGTWCTWLDDKCCVKTPLTNIVA